MLEDEQKKLNIINPIFVIIFLAISYYISPMLCILMSLLLFSRKKESRILSLFAGFSLALPALYYVPLVTDDASRIFFVMQGMSRIPIDGLISWLRLWAGDYLNYPIFTGLMYIISQRYQNDLLPFIVAGISYSLVIYVVSKFSRIFKIPQLIKYLALFSSVLWISFLELISGMRFTLACCVAILILLNIFIFNDFKTIKNYLSLLWFLIPLAIHPGVSLILAPIFVILIARQKNVVLKSSILFIVIVGVMLLLSGYGSKFTYVEMLKNRLSIYQTTSFGYVSSLQKLIHFFVAIVTALLGTIQLHGASKNDPTNKTIFKNLFYMNFGYLLYFSVSILSLNFGMRLVAVIPIIFILSIAADTSEYLDNREVLFNCIMLILLIIAGFIYNVSFFHINFSDIKWFFPFYNV